MMRRYIVILAMFLAALALGLGCDDRGTNIKTVDTSSIDDLSGVYPGADHVYVKELTLQLRNPQEQLLGTAYIPDEAQGEDARPVPSLILLAPQDGDKWFYFRAGLEELLKQLTVSGKIQPMVVLCVGNNDLFGGYFYGNSDPAGMMDSIMHFDQAQWDTATVAYDIVQYMHWFFPSTIESKAKRGIGGVGQGSYGAFRAVIKNPDVWGSISVTDGPLDFDGANGSSGLMSLFDDAMTEQHAYYASYPTIDTTYDTITTSPLDIDTTLDTLPFEYRRDFDSSKTMPISEMFIGGSLAFSPNDTLINYVRNPNGSVSSVVRYRLTDGLPPAPYDVDGWKTLIDTLIKGDSYAKNLSGGMDFHLPFDEDGTVFSPIWNMWMQNNLDTLYLHDGGTPLSGVNIWIGTNPGAAYQQYAMTQSWLQFLSSQGVPFEQYNYSGYNGDVISGNEYIFDLLTEMLIFHSENFGD